MYILFRRDKKGQSILEYVVVISVVIAALIVMGIYMKRGVEGKLKESSDDVGQQFLTPYLNATTYNTTFSGTVGKITAGNAMTGSDSTTTQYTAYSQNRTGSGTFVPKPGVDVTNEALF